jgi:hypothetical protein
MGVFKLATPITKQNFEGHLPNIWSPNCTYQSQNALILKEWKSCFSELI